MRPVVISFICFYGCLTAWGQAEPVTPTVETGLASWYGAPYHGRQSASGEIYDQELLTAAHRTLPFGARVRVRRLDRNRSVIVRINDRGPFVDSRIIDLSHAAAVRLGMATAGLAPVSVEVIEARPVVSFDVRPHRVPARNSEAPPLIARHITVNGLASTAR